VDGISISSVGWGALFAKTRRNILGLSWDLCNKSLASAVTTRDPRPRRGATWLGGPSWEWWLWACDSKNLSVRAVEPLRKRIGRKMDLKRKGTGGELLTRFCERCAHFSWTRSQLGFASEDWKRRSRFPAPEFPIPPDAKSAGGEERRDRHSFRSNNIARWINGLLSLAAILWVLTQLP